ncbi:acetyltransferase (GNAT) family protein [Winogradskyella epiphytica]|uniref:Acetyltransferase (GNAT) family protein n=1 Tax=Winogradskyella epiphytica TaxID=262005 RepID=A0A2V4WXI2_9FLAO|nr:GNAT family N-acetyltransferase [Winogradskyella epiphytica]PYE81960.1 acetyltransferase (GNAT) family protein [Winogradskyella epiphytica]GGW61492.1 hypothetical protein GCM10008085_11320 [Winogradskyella epiphytica]
MIKKLQNSNIEISQNILKVFRASYAIEAKLLNASDFPPLNRPLENYINSKTQFFGYYKNQRLAGVVEIDNNQDYTLIRSLVVDPIFFRQGIASALIEFVFKTFESDLFIVETGVDNGPAIKLYKNFGFTEVMQWDTEFGIRKVKFELRSKT